MVNLFESANLFFVLVAVLGLYMNFHWRKRVFDDDTREVIAAWNWIYLAMGARAAWFWIIWETVDDDAILRKTSSFFVDHRDWVIVLTSLAFGYGVLKFIRLIEEKSVKWMISIFGGLIVLTGLLGLN